MMRLKKHAIIFLFAWLSFSLSAENQYTKDTTFVRAQIDASSNLVFVNPDKAQPHIDSILYTSHQINYQFGLYLGHNYQAILYFMTGNYQESIKEYKIALKYVDPEKPIQKIRLYSNISLSHRLLNNDDSTLIYLKIVNEKSAKYRLLTSYYQSVLDLGSYYMDKEDFVNAVSYYAETESNCAVSTDSVFLIKAYSSLAMFYQKVNDFDKSYECYQKAITIDEAYEDLNFLASNYSNLGETFLRLKDNYDTAIYFFRKSMDMSLPFKLQKQTLTCNVNIGNAFLESDRIDSAYIYYLKAYNNELVHRLPEAKTAVLINLGMYYNKDLQFERAFDFLTEGLGKAKELELISFQRSAFQELSELESARGNYREALDYHEQFYVLSDSLKNIDAKHQLALVEYEKLKIKEKFNNEFLLQQNENQNQEILVQRIIIFIVFLAILLLMVLVLVVSRNRKRINLLNTNLHRANDDLELVNEDLLKQKTEMKELLMSKDRFVSILGHDLKNPFSGLLGMLDLMDKDWDELSDEEKKDGIKLLSETSKLTYRLLEELLDWGKSQQGLIIAENSEFEIVELFKEVENIFSLLIRKKNIHIDIISESALMVNSDRKLCSQILQNFLGNALKYSYVGGKIQIKAEQKEKHILICVIDEGIGIPSDKIEELFKLDGKFNRPGTLREQSTGMGLILCKEYANIIDAEIEVKSEVDKGSSFCLVIKN